MESGLFQGILLKDWINIGQKMDILGHMGSTASFQHSFTKGFIGKINKNWKKYFVIRF